VALKNYFTKDDDSFQYGEWVCYKAFRNLSDNWTIIHSLQFQLPSGNTTIDHEIDFLLVHPERGLLVCETKGGILNLDDGIWSQENAGGSQRGSRHELNRSPFEQAKDNRYGLCNLISNKVRNDRELNAKRSSGHMVALPSMNLNHGYGPEGDRAIILDKNDLKSDRIELRLKNIADYWRTKQIEDSTCLTIISALAPERIFLTQPISALNTAMEAISEAIQELTEQQIEIMKMLRANKRLTVKGHAGSGKTVLALERAKQFSDEGISTLLVCFNSLLADELKEQLKGYENITVTNFHRLCKYLIREAELELNDEARNLRNLIDNNIASWEEKNRFFDEIQPDLMSKSAEKLNKRFGSIIIDEAQDFNDHWIIALQELLEDDGSLYIFGDPLQSIFNENSLWENVGGATMVLDKNVRNVGKISEAVSSIFETNDDVNKVRGGKATFTKITNDEQISKKIIKKITRLVNEGAQPDQMVILCNETDRGVHLENAIRESDLNLQVLRKGINDEENQDDEYPLIIETINRFKGLEKEIIFLVLPEKYVEDEIQLKKLAYVGSSRATAQLHIYGTSEQKVNINWPH
tara:strand:+ start:336 stop:2078 length:1743 start_codon:yes stop_codon:yes gene_type:complete